MTQEDLKKLNLELQVTSYKLQKKCYPSNKNVKEGTSE